jgi:predicted nucleic acid-binding protein
MKLADALDAVTLLGLDTAPVIYFIEAHSRHGPLVAEIVRRMQQGQLEAHTSVVTLAETMVQPLIHQNARLQDAYRTFLLRTTGIVTHAMRPATAERAATLRGRYRLPLPDALQVAQALDAGCQAFLTNDLRLKRVTDLRVVVLDELEL